MKRIKHAFTRKRITTKDKLKAVGVILVLEVFLGIFLWGQSKPRPHQGFIVKNGQQYIVFWRDKNLTQGMEVTASLDEAVNYAKTELNLKVGAEFSRSQPLEHLWMRSGIGEYVVYWKTMNIPFLNRMTFRSESEAKAYQTAFREGAYSPSPIGHAISLIPISKN